MPKLRCLLFGHKVAPPGWWGDIPYGRISARGVDNVGRVHGVIEQECHRCGEHFMVARLHLNDRAILRAIERDPKLFNVEPVE